MIDYPEDDELRAQSREHDLALPVLVRDIVRVVEVLAEKILGWCVHGLVKHYADIAWITVATQNPGSSLTFEYPKLREVLDAKLATMRNLQPEIYRPFPTVEAIVGKLAQTPEFDRTQWQKLVYLRSQRAAFDQEDLRRIVQQVLAPGLRSSQPR